MWYFPGCCCFVGRNKMCISSEKTRIWIRKVVLLHDNALPHTANLIHKKLEKMLRATLKHPPCSPDLSSCDYQKFGLFKESLRGERFDDFRGEIRHNVLWKAKQIGYWEVSQVTRNQGEDFLSKAQEIDAENTLGVHQVLKLLTRLPKCKCFWSLIVGWVPDWLLRHWDLRASNCHGRTSNSEKLYKANCSTSFSVIQFLANYSIAALPQPLCSHNLSPPGFFSIPLVKIQLKKTSFWPYKELAEKRNARSGQHSSWILPGEH